MKTCSGSASIRLSFWKVDGHFYKIKADILHFHICVNVTYLFTYFISSCISSCRRFTEVWLLPVWSFQSCFSNTGIRIQILSEPCRVPSHLILPRKSTTLSSPSRWCCSTQCKIKSRAAESVCKYCLWFLTKTVQAVQLISHFLFCQTSIHFTCKKYWKQFKESTWARLLRMRHGSECFLIFFVVFHHGWICAFWEP